MPKKNKKLIILDVKVLNEKHPERFVELLKHGATIPKTNYEKVIAKKTGLTESKVKEVLEELKNVEITVTKKQETTKGD